MEARIDARPSGPFEVTTGQRFPVDGRGEGGPPPLALLLGALGSCHAAVLAHIFQVMKMEWERLQLTLEGELDGDPKVFTHIHLAYEVRGNGLDGAKVKKAVGLAGKYCSVTALLERAGVALSHETTVAPAG